jgi:dephospho-CoA kinase
MQLHRAKNPSAVVLVESAVLFEAGQHKRFDKMVVAWCRPEQQVERFRSRSSLSDEDIRARMAAQMPGEEKKRMADFVIDTSVSLADTERQVKEVYTQLQALASQPTRASF